MLEITLGLNAPGAAPNALYGAQIYPRLAIGVQFTPLIPHDLSFCPSWGNSPYRDARSTDDIGEQVQKFLPT